MILIFNLITEWRYDQQDRAILSQHANAVEKVTIEFDPRTHKDMPANYSSNKPIFKNIVTNSLGQKTTYSYQVDGTQYRLFESLGAGCASCGEVNKRYRYNAQGLVSYTADLDQTGQVLRAIDLKYNQHAEVVAKTVSAVGVQAQTTYNVNNIPQLRNLTNNYKHAAQCNNLNLSMQFFGEYLHAFEDTFAHRDQHNDPFAVKAGVGHGTHGSHPDYTYNHYGYWEKENLIGSGDWTVNEQRSLMEQGQVYFKLVEYRRDILKVPDNKTKVVPWNELKDYLAVYNAIPEKLDHAKDIGSLYSVNDKVKLLENLLNGTPIKDQYIYRYDPSNKQNMIIQTKDLKTNWNYKTKQGASFNLISHKGNAYYTGKDGYSIPQAITNRISVFQNLTKAQKGEYKNLIWDTSVSGYISNDGESPATAQTVRNYKLTTFGIHYFTDKPFIISGTPPAK